MKIVVQVSNTACRLLFSPATAVTEASLVRCVEEAAVSALSARLELLLLHVVLVP